MAIFATNDGPKDPRPNVSEDGLQELLMETMELRITSLMDLLFTHIDCFASFCRNLPHD
jgi:hypothetical protein